MTKQQLRDELDEVVATLNDKRFRDGEYDYELDTHAKGTAIDITKGGEPTDKVLGQFGRAAMRAGYVIVGTLVHNDSVNYDHTRIFLHEADEHFDLGADEEALDDARLEGFAAGMLFGSTMTQLSALYPNIPYDGDEFDKDIDIDADELVEELESLEDDESTGFEPLDNETAIKEIERMNKDLLVSGRFGGLVDAYDDVRGDLYVHSFDDDTDPSEFDTPKGWYAIDDDRGIGFVTEVTDRDVAELVLEQMNADVLEQCGGIIGDGDDSLYVATPERINPSDFETPSGWVAEDGYRGVNFVHDE
jgi:hypothetical protein